MKRLLGFGIFCLCLLLGVVIKSLIDFPIPEAVYGMAILLILMLAKIVRVKHVEDAGQVVLENLAFLFIVPGVALVDQLDILQSKLVPIILIAVISAIITMTVTCKAVELIQNARRKA